MDVHFNAYKVKYQMMDTLFLPIIRSKEIRSCNIYIDLDDIFHKLHRPSVAREVQLSGEHAGKQIISNVLNIIAHYRQWAVRKGWQTRVIAFYTSAIHGGFKNNLYVPKYRKHFCDINHELSSEYYFINQAIRESEKLFRIMSQYIDKVYIIDSRYLEPSIIPMWFSEHVFRASWNILISRDPYDLQYSYIDTWSFVCPKGENTRIFDRSNMWDFIASTEKIKDYSTEYDPSLFPLTLSVVGDSYRNIPRIKRVGWKTLFSILERISKYSEDKTRTTMQILLCQELVSKNTTMENITNNLNAIDIEAQYARIGDIEKADLQSQIIDVPDYENLLELNQMYFSKYPINLPFLTEQKEISRKSKNPFGIY